MVKRNKTKTVTIGNIKIGSSHPVEIQSMTKVATSDVELCLRQIKQLAAAGCHIVRCAVPTPADTAALPKLVAKSPVPLVADIHFSPQRAIEAIEAGVAKIRLNPGNIKSPSDILRIIDAAKMHSTAIRIGVNEASIRDLQKGDVAAQNRTALMLKEMKKYVNIFEKRRFRSLVLSAKSSDVLRTIEVNRAIALTFDYPVHIGLTHAGLPEDAQIPSAVALGTLLAEGIGDTVRVSLAGDPVAEVRMAKQILVSLGMSRRSEPELIVCPTCGRAQIDVVTLAGEVRKALASIHKPLRIAVMGCVVNGPGEAADADIALCCGRDKAFLYRKGEKIATVAKGRMVDVVVKEIKRF
jgi:(E)-4-hydroxy-3-methylbut-2-enyl-diphosphate synthase